VPYLLAALLQISAFAQNSEIKHWELDLAATDVDLSPDDRLLAVSFESPLAPQKSREPVVESVQVWDYRQNRRVSSVQLASYVNVKPTPNVVRFTADGLLLVASEPTKLHILEAATLKSLRVIEPPLAPAFRIFHVETAPSGHIALVGANQSGVGMLFAYDLDSGTLVFQSKLPRGISSIAWKEDGTQFAVATPFLCARARDTVHVFSISPWSHLHTLSARHPTSLAFSQKHLFFVESGFCKGSMFDRHLGLQSFDSRQWRRQETLLLKDRDIHDSVSFANGRLLADTGKLRTEHNWLDATTSGTPVDVQFTVWREESPSIEFTSPSWTTHQLRPASRFRLSRTGKMILAVQKNPEVFQLP
jgi:hypothetical protein